jgi:hypothetical protein
MKRAIICLLPAWFAIVLELAFPNTLPHGVLLLPVVCGTLAWSVSASSLLTAGTVLLLDWIARPTLYPVNAFLLPLLTAMASSHSDDGLTVRRRKTGWIPTALRLPLFVTLAVILQTAGNVPLNAMLQLEETGRSVLKAVVPMLMIAVPLSAVMVLVYRVCDEFGLTRTE